MRESRAGVAAAAAGVLVVAAVVLFAVLQQQRGASPVAEADGAGPAAAAGETARGGPNRVRARAEEAGPPVRESSAERAALGRRVYRENGCARCHSIAGEGGRRSVLDGVGSRLSREEIRLWIVAPDEIGPGVRKPAYDDLPPEEVEALVDYLASLTAAGR